MGRGGAGQSAGGADVMRGEREAVATAGGGWYKAEQGYITVVLPLRLPF